MRRFGKLLEKNFKSIWRSKSSVLIILLAPLVFSILLGMAFNNTDPYTIHLGVYSETYTELKTSIIDDLSENFKVSRFHSEASCITTLKDGKVHVCIFLPEGMEVEATNASTITFHVDNSRVNLVWMILDTISSRISTSSAEISSALTKELVDRIDLTGKELSGFLANLSEFRNSTMEMIETLRLAKISIVDLDISSTLRGSDAMLTQDEQLEEKLKPYYTVEAELGEFIEALKLLNRQIKIRLGAVNVSSDVAQALEIDVDKIKADIDILKKSTGSAAAEAQTLSGGLKDSADSLNKEIFSINVEANNLILTIEALDRILQQNLATIDSLQSHAQRVLDSIDSLAVTNIPKIVRPILTEIRPLSLNQSRLSFVFPNLLVLMVMFTALLFSASIGISDNKSRAALRNRILPSGAGLFLAANYVSNVLVVGLQTVFFVAISLAYFKIGLTIGWLAALVIFGTISLFTLLGLGIGSLFHSEHAGMMASLGLSSIFLFFSNTILPLESAPLFIQSIIQYNPFVLSEGILRKILVHELGFLTLQNDIFLLAGYIIAALVIVVVINGIRTRSYLSE